jgi:hypothetical protein
MKELNSVLFRCIDETLAGVLGLLGRDALYLDLLTSFSVTREELPRNLESLVAILQKNFGSSATKVISRAIAKRLYSEVQLQFEEKPDFGLLDYVGEAKTALLKSSQLNE